MTPFSRSGWPKLIAVFFLFLSLLNIAVSSPLPGNHGNKDLAARGYTPPPLKPNISIDRYQKFLKKYFPATNTYLFYSGGAGDQVKNFIKANPEYHWFNDMFNTPQGDEDTQKHPWWKAFDADVDEDDADAASMAMAMTVSGDVLVFGAAEYMTAGQSSFFKTKEIEKLQEGMRTGRVKSINHMAKDATKATQIMAKEDVNGKFTWQPGYKEGDKNASSFYGQCKRALGSKCDAPTIRAKPKPAKGNCKRAGTTNGAACQLEKPTPATPKKPTPTPKKSAPKKSTPNTAPKKAPKKAPKTAPKAAPKAAPKKAAPKSQ
jgi:hypothetical protein